MARPPQSNSSQTRKRMLHAASLLFAEHGRKGASVRAIADKAHVNVAMVSHYFGSKQGLYQACLDELYRELDEGRTELATAFQAGQSPGHLVLATVEKAYRVALENRLALRLIMRDILDKGQLDPDRSEDSLAPFLSQFAFILESISIYDAPRIRLALQSLLFLTTRFALSSEEELKLITNNESDPRAAVLSYLKSTAVLMLGIKHEEPL